MPKWSASRTGDNGTGSMQPTAPISRACCGHILSQTCHTCSSNWQRRVLARFCKRRTLSFIALTLLLWSLFNTQTTPLSARLRHRPRHCKSNASCGSHWMLPAHSSTVFCPSSQRCSLNPGAIASICSDSPTTNNSRILRRQKKP
ncbi:hypothetical protein D3C75_733750 [compost metagenome]